MKTKKKAKKEVHIEEDLLLKDAKFKVTIYIDGDVLEAIREAAEKAKTKYQPFINKILRERFIGDAEESLEARVSRLEMELLKKHG